MAKKMRDADDFLHHLYVHMNELNQFVIFSGLTFREFVSAVGPLQNILLLKNEYEDGSFNRIPRDKNGVFQLGDLFKLTDKVKTDFIDISNISREEMKMLVDLYYQLQDNRKRSREQIRSIEQDRDGGKSCNASINFSLVISSSCSINLWARLNLHFAIKQFVSAGLRKSPCSV